LVMITSNRKLMGSDTNHPVTTAIGWAIGLLVTVLNMMLIYLTLKGH
jgi:manganese transport protein